MCITITTLVDQNNPRLIEFICNPNRYKNVLPEKYYDFIEQQLNNPKEIWKDEYERKLQKTDRILLTTLYSFSDTIVEQNLIKECFEERIKNEVNIDKTINQFEASMIRLIDGFIRIVDDRGVKKLSVINPSINDYLDGHFSNNIAEKEILINSCHYVKQLYRMLSPMQFDNWAKSILINHQVERYLFDNNNQKLAFIAFYISESCILDEFYLSYIQLYINNPVPLWLNVHIVATLTDIIEGLLQSDVCNFYNIEQCVLREGYVSKLFSNLEIDELINMILVFNIFFNGEKRAEFINEAINALEIAIDNYSDYIDIDDLNVDGNRAVFQATYRYGDDIDVDIDSAISNVEAEAEARGEVIAKLKKLPFDIVISDEFLNNLSFNIIGADELVDLYLPDDSDDLQNPCLVVDDDSEIDYIFARN